MLFYDKIFHGFKLSEYQHDIIICDFGYINFCVIHTTTYQQLFGSLFRKGERLCNVVHRIVSDV